LQNSLLPSGLAEETLRTLMLLFPRGDSSRPRRWVSKQIRKHNLDPTLGHLGNLRVHDRRFERFDYWHDRLVILKQAFDESNPRTLRHWWNDRRNSVQWYTFWVAILIFATTIFFGIVQSLEGGMQVWLSWKALERDGGKAG